MNCYLSVIPLSFQASPTDINLFIIHLCFQLRNLGFYIYAAMNSSRIRQIVQLRQMMKKWRTLALTRKVSTVNRCALLGRCSDSDEECCRSPPPPPADVPEGYLAIYVGKEEMRRFIIPTTYLSRPAFRSLLDKAEEEFGFDYQGVLTIPCEMAVFENILKNEGYELQENEVVSLSCKKADVATISSTLLQESSIA